jgi:hypothetical protein
MEVLDIENLGQNCTIEHVVDSGGHPAYRVCRGGICRFAEDRYLAGMYAEHFGWKPNAS